jgi:hypothetical protein
MIGERQRDEAISREAALYSTKDDAVEQVAVRPGRRKDCWFVRVCGGQQFKPRRCMKDRTRGMPVYEFAPPWVAKGINLMNHGKGWLREAHL